jgi:benzoate-CoA ligase
MTLRIPEQFNAASWFVDRPAAEHPERLAILGEPAAVTYGELAAMVNRVGNALRHSGVARGDRVLLVLRDSAEFIAAFFGALKMGAVAVPVNPMARASDYAYYVQDTEARVAIVDAEAWSEFQAGAEARRPGLVVRVGKGAAGNGGVQDWQGWVHDAGPELHVAPTRSTDAAFFLYTSGSTGEPKAAVHQHQDMLVTTECFARGIMQIGPGDRTFSVSKLFFAYGLGNAMYFPLAAGASTVLDPERPRPDRVLALVAKHRPTIFYSVPTFYAALLQAADSDAQADFSSVRLAVSAGEALPVEIFERFHRRFGLEVLDAIGSTEMLHMFLSGRPGRIRPGSCGTPLEHYDAKIVDDEGRELGTGEIGNLWVRGQSAFSHYWNKPEATAGAKRGDWVVTSDKFQRDADGFYHYCGRADDMLKVSGLWVSPTEVENALLGHPAVAEAAVVGRADEAGLTRTVAYVVPKPAAEPGLALAEDIRGFVKQRLVAYKCPQTVVFVGELPKTPTGKIQRFRLRSL